MVNTSFKKILPLSLALVLLLDAGIVLGMNKNITDSTETKTVFLVGYHDWAHAIAHNFSTPVCKGNFSQNEECDKNKKNIFKEDKESQIASARALNAMIKKGILPKVVTLEKTENLDEKLRNILCTENGFWFKSGPWVYELSKCTGKSICKINTGSNDSSKSFNENTPFSKTLGSNDTSLEKETNPYKVLLSIQKKEIKKK